MTHYHRLTHATARREFVWLLLLGLNTALWGKTLHYSGLIWIGAALVLVCAVGVWVHTVRIYKTDNPPKSKPDVQIQRRATRQGPGYSPRSQPGRTVPNEVEPAAQ